MTALQNQLKKILAKTKSNKETIYVFGDLQDTPVNSKSFHYGSCQINKHPLGITRACEDFGLTCTIYPHMHNMEKPIISRHGTKGGRFIDSMYANHQGINCVNGISIIQDTGIPSDHDMVISKIDIGISKFEVCKDKEQRIDFQQNMNIPIRITAGQNHPMINELVFKGMDFMHHEKLYRQLQEITRNKEFLYEERITNIRDTLIRLEKITILRTKETISMEDQISGKLVHRMPEDALTLNDASAKFFTLINEICSKAHLVSVVPIVPNIKSQKKD
jgi:hypothetical protein